MNEYPNYKQHDTSSIFSRRLVQVMKEKSISSADLADLVFVSNSTIAGYRSGRRHPNLEQLTLIAKTLSVSTDYLLGLENIRGASIETTAPR